VVVVVVVLVVVVVEALVVDVVVIAVAGGLVARVDVVCGAALAVAPQAASKVTTPPSSHSLDRLRR
jgi:hypothetical protein